MSETLYNGITIPATWPPSDMDPAVADPMPVPYIDNPPVVIRIDVGRQLFVDDFLIQETTLEQVFHKPERYAGNPVLKAETVQETEIKSRVGLQQGGVFYNPAKNRFEMFYHSGTLDPRRRHLAFSRDMIHWERPGFGDGTGNLFREPGPQGEHLPPGTAGSVFAVWLDCETQELDKRYKMFGLSRKDPHAYTLHTSPDGVNWSKPVCAGPASDAQSLFYNPFRGVWVFSIKQSVLRNNQNLRGRWYVEARDFLQGGNWKDAIYWTCADRLDLPEPADGYPAHPVRGEPCQLYALHGVAYESIMLGLHEIHRGPENPVCKEGKFPKLTDLELGFSRDGFHWHRPDRSGFIKGMRREGHWDRAYVHGTTSILVIHEDRLVFPYSGYSGADPDGTPGIYNGGAIGLATLRRDGFASMRASDKEETLLTRPVMFNGKHLFVNLDCPCGRLRVEVDSVEGHPFPGFAMSDCLPLSADGTKIPVLWKHADTLAALAGQPVRFRFHLEKGDLYAFWISPSARGQSGGYVAGGGPAFSGPRDD